MDPVLDAELQQPGKFTTTTEGTTVTLTLPTRLPYAEYRYLIAQGAKLVERQFVLRVAAWKAAEPLLRTRLGATG